MANRESNENTANYFYPDDVDSTQEKAGKVSEGELSKLFFAVLGLLDFFGVFALPTFLENLGIGLFGSLLILVAINILLVMTIFRFVVFDENKKAREYRAHTSDNFARFFKINKNTVETIEVRGYGEAQLFQYNNGHYLVALRLRYGSSDTEKAINIKINKNTVETIEVRGYGEAQLFQYNNGHYLVALRLRYGSSDTEKAINTREAYERIYRLLGQYRMEFKLLSTSENFRESAEYARYRERQNKSKYKELSNRIFENLMKYTDAYSNVTMNTLLIRTTSKGQTLDLPLVLSEIVRNIEMYNTSIRGVEFLEFPQFIEFVREYYGLEAIDLLDLPLVLSEIVRNIEMYNTSIRGVEFLEFPQFIEFVREYYGLEAIDLSRLKDMEQNYSELNRMLKEVGVFEIRSNNDFKRSKTWKDNIESKMFTGTEEV